MSGPVLLGASHEGTGGLLLPGRRPLPVRRSHSGANVINPTTGAGDGEAAVHAFPLAGTSKFEPSD
jgi:hypothetical protein